ncbi:MAG: DUF362 domain-containing protein [Candidatus Aminicenantales bacterium]
MPISKVVLVKAKGILASDGSVDSARARRAMEAGLRELTGAGRAVEAAGRLFSRSDRAGIKINAIAGRSLTTKPETSLALAGLLTDAGLPASNIIIWDRTNRELKEAGYKLNLALGGPKVMGTDTNGFGYESEISSHRTIGSLFSTLLTRNITASISLALLKDHGMAGVTAGMKNYYGAVHNPNKYHDSGCNPYIADLLDTPEVKSKHKLTILDCLLVQYHRGPSHHARWAERLETILFSLDPVAADSAGWTIIERLRAGAGLPSLKEDGREPIYLDTAERLGLGNARPENIRTVDLEV